MSRSYFRVISSRNTKGCVITSASLSDGVPISIKVLSYSHYKQPNGSASVAESILPEKLQGYVEWSEATLSPVLKPLKLSKTLRDALADTKDLDRNTLSAVAEGMFPKTNPKTGEVDVSRDTENSEYIPLVTVTGTLPPQKAGTSLYFNPEGTLSVAEVFDALHTFKYGKSLKENRKTSLDNLSSEKDYFNEGYNECLSGFSSPLYRLYTRKELTLPITRAELAYLAVCCWQGFECRFRGGAETGLTYGIKADWYTPDRYLMGYADGDAYKITKVNFNDTDKAVSFNIKDYVGEDSMTSFKSSVKTGERGVPLPWIMSLIELDLHSLFPFNKELGVLREVSRAEFSYFICHLAELFSKESD